MKDERFDFRWGISLLDDQPGYAKVYEFMLDNYAEVVTRAEFMCIVHLARYHYNSERGESRPSLETIAKQMGYGHKNSVSRLVASLEAKGLLIVTRRPGFTSIYDAGPFARRMMSLAGITAEGDTSQCGRGITPQCDTGITPQCGGVSHPSVPEEEKDIERKEEKEKKRIDFLAQMKKTDRERIRDVLIDVLANGAVPATEYLLRPFERAVDTLSKEFRELYGKSRLDSDLASKIMAAIRGAYENDANWQFDKADTPTRPVLACIVAQGKADMDRAAANTTAGRRERYAYPGVQI